MTGDYISRNAAKKVVCEGCNAEFGEDPCEPCDCAIMVGLEAIPAADVRPVVLCGVCELHGHCYTEDVFAFARLAEANRFCAVGKVKTNGEWRRKTDD